VTIRLPLVLRRPRYRITYAAIWLPYIALYQIINRFPLFEPRELPLTTLDQAIPFIPALLPLYVAYIPFFWWTGARSEDDDTATRFFYATHLQLLLCATVWVLFPVTMPRDLFYSPSVYNWADMFWRWFDAPNNCLPSLHAANCLLFIRFNWQRPLRVIHTLVALSIIASTVIVKQHYVVDAVAGALVFLVACAFLERLRLESPSARNELPADGSFARDQ
jgi:membrane-associated phospholipid phosphatase